MQEESVIALTYVRLSTPRQTTRGHGQESQLAVINLFMTAKGYLPSAQVFKDRIPGETTNGPA